MLPSLSVDPLPSRTTVTAGGTGDVLDQLVCYGNRRLINRAYHNITGKSASPEGVVYCTCIVVVCFHDRVNASAVSMVNRQSVGQPFVSIYNPLREVLAVSHLLLFI